MSFKSIVVHVLASWVLAAGVYADESAERLFALKVQPMLKDKCQGCHGGDSDDLKGEFSVLTREALLRGGESEEAAIVPGKPDEGTFVSAIKWESLEMPPKENDRLTEQQIEMVRKWIEQGAPWPDEKTQAAYREEEARKRVTDEGMIVDTSGGTSDQWTSRRYPPEDLWAFLPVKAKSELLPADVEREQAIDHFVDAQLDKAEITAAPLADANDLIRRATYDLTGLPPTPADVADFNEAYSKQPDQALAALIDRLLDSPRYGEHWARHWLDVTRYADTGGMSNDFERSNMWRYRDYVIRAFNSDKPYNEFIVEQLAGDELADASVRVRNSGSQEAVNQAQLKGKYSEQESEWLVATGFLRLGPWDNAMVEVDEARQIYLDDVVNITGQTFLSQTLRCCKCHDHKFDPIPTRDYYRVYSAFSTTQMAERNVPFLPQEDLSHFEAGKAHVQRMLDFAVEEKNRIVVKQEAAARAWYKEHDLPYKSENERKDDSDEMKPPRHVGLDHVEQGQLKVREQDEWIWTRRLERYEPMAQSVYNAAKTDLAWNGARKLRISRKHADADPQESFILSGGALTALGDRVFPGVLSALTLTVGTQSDDPYLLTNDVNGRRLELAKWIANPENALTTRSIVNRIWQYHFGTGIAANANNFGGKGAKPTHPMLLDYLAEDFVEGDWSIKRMHRLIMMSDVYRRSTTKTDSEQLAEVDPNNSLLSHFPRRRLTAEELRDSMLSATGELVHCDGGVPVMPEINMEVALQPRMIQFSLAPAYQPSPTPDLRNRRTIYAYGVRGQADPFTELFNEPNPNESCEQRETAAVAPQVFALLNSDLITDRSIAMALRLQSESQEMADQIRTAFQLILLREPTEQELERLSRYVKEMTAYHENVNAEEVEYPASITRSLVEEFSGETFEYEEILPVFDRYEADRKPSEVGSETRALADMCLLLFNTNEFIYVE
ncbi:PSD1 and planctomycete cytochrome C domain-containing protein [Neorhodopirellula pilleata]|uniref:Planctomycete cytochrome C n=1 Tax=Neorhodopirellula pilleata TaxID=2714738 RepID=A0A5C5ZCY9_9BACT|nr:PSD1 and planctomycete cytochrome C domain-containing protein [Neorhodopirellula pilleata]TWT85192.1 Planctomycete cytochrome C [Neorhodopirellula pilleata]